MPDNVHTTDSVITQLKSDIALANEATGTSDTTMHDAVARLVEGYGGNNDNSLGLAGVNVGDIPKVKAVDENGRPTEWDVANILCSDEEFKLLLELDISEATPVITIDGLDGLNNIMVLWRDIQNSSSVNSGMDIHINDTVICQMYITSSKTGAAFSGYSVALYNGVTWLCYRTNGAISPENFAGGSPFVPYNVQYSIEPANKIELKTANPIYAPVSGNIKIYGKKSGGYKQM